jgi:hypothetical protein
MMVMVLTSREWNLDIPKPTMAQLDAFETQATTYENNQKIIANIENLYKVLGKSQVEEI